MFLAIRSFPSVTLFYADNHIIGNIIGNIKTAKEKPLFSLGNNSPAFS